MDDDELVSEVKAAELLGISRTSMYRLRKAGEIPYVRLKRNVAYRRSRLSEWIKGLERTEVA